MVDSQDDAGGHTPQAGANRFANPGVVVTAPLNSSAGDPRCHNCGAALEGAFCASCGQRSVPVNPTVSELAGDAWNELSGYDGRIAASFRNLMRPGQLTVDYLQGRRARYLPPVRLYLITSVVYFLVAAAAPQGAGGLRIGVWDDRGDMQLSAEDRAALDAELADSPWPVRVMLDSIAKDPEAFRARIFTILPRVFIAMLPVYAGIVWLFYRQMRFPAALVFAVHLHAFAFLAMAISEAAKFSGSDTIGLVVAVIMLVVLSVYALRAQHVVFGGTWPEAVAKATFIGLIYMMTAVPAFIVTFIWASMV
jgi:hypothetical protein